MKTGKYLLLIFITHLSGTAFVFSQGAAKQTPFFVPQSAMFGAYSNFHWFLNDGFDANFTDHLYLRASLKYGRNFELVVINKTKFKSDSHQNKFSDIYCNYRGNIKDNARVPIFRYGTYLNLKIGVIEWYPTYTNVQLILENAEKFINPSQIYGGSIISITPLTRDKSLNINIGAHTGDLMHNDLDAELVNLFLNYTKKFKYSLGVSTQVGIAQGSRHVVNFAQVLYQPRLEKMQFDIRIGKLPTNDETPYGIHLGINRTFKYISLGGYYERRLNQETKGEIAGISWNIIGPPKLAKFVSTFNLFYDFNTNTIWMWIPLLKIDIQYK